MAVLKLEIIDQTGNVLAAREEEDEVSLAYRGQYHQGDKIRLTSSHTPVLLKIRLDDSLAESRVCLSEKEFTFEIPFEEKRKPYGQKAFTQERHWGYASVVTGEELDNYINLAQNPFDGRDNQGLYPHAVSNVSVSNPQFFAENAIDGVFETCNHGSWPHSSWGINQQEDAWLRIEFGRPVKAQAVILYLRADFPHDNWWKQVRLSFSDGTEMEAQLNKTGKGQKISFPEKTVAWVRLSHLQMSEEESRFPALSQIMVMGREADGADTGR